MSRQEVRPSLNRPALEFFLPCLPFFLRRNHPIYIEPFSIGNKKMKTFVTVLINLSDPTSRGFDHLFMFLLRPPILEL
jgi:hypothetical protein